jgi:hypothetical protein
MTSRNIMTGLFLVALLGAAGPTQVTGTPDENIPARGVFPREQQLKKVEFPGGSCDLYLLAQEMVQKDLGLSADQVAKIRELVADLIEKKRTLTFEKHVQQLKKDQQIALDLLTREQIQRLKQLSLQCGATASFWNPSVRQTLQISDQQWQKIERMPYPKEVGDVEAERLHPIRKEFFDYPKRPEQEWQHREWQRIAELTPMQRLKWKEMLGRPFDGAFPSAILVPATVTTQAPLGEPSIEALRLEIKTLRERLIQMERRLVEIEKGKKK